MKMFTKFKSILLTFLMLSLCACEPIRDSYEDCGVWLEFIFDYNMEFADSFDTQVKTVDVFIFDKEGRFVEARHAGIDELEGCKRMFIGDGLPFGEYRILTVGNLAAPFSFTHSGSLFTPGMTTMEDAVLALNTGAASQEFDHIFFGTAVEVDFKADLSVWPVPLIRETNKFNILLQINTSGNSIPQHTVEIVAPESGAYGYLNNPVRPDRLVYLPYSLHSKLDNTKDGVVQETTAHINTMRLLENEWDGYRIVVRDVASGREIWSNNLLSLLAATRRPFRPDGTSLPNSEYFDREGEWNIVIVYKSVDPPPVDPPVVNPPVVDPPVVDPPHVDPPVVDDPKPGFLVLKIIVNDWIIWNTGIGI